MFGSNLVRSYRLHTFPLSGSSHVSGDDDSATLAKVIPTRFCLQNFLQQVLVTFFQEKFQKMFLSYALSYVNMIFLSLNWITLSRFGKKSLEWVLLMQQMQKCTIPYNWLTKLLANLVQWTELVSLVLEQWDLAWQLTCWDQTFVSLVMM